MSPVSVGPNLVLYWLFAGISGRFNREQLEHLHECLPDCVAYCEVSHPVFKAEIRHGGWPGPMRGNASAPRGTADPARSRNSTRIRDPIRSPDASKAVLHRSSLPRPLQGGVGSGTVTDGASAGLSERVFPIQPVAQRSRVSGLPRRRLVQEPEGDLVPLHLSCQACSTRQNTQENTHDIHNTSFRKHLRNMRSVYEA